MPDFKNLDDMFRYIKNNPGKVLDGQKTMGKCQKCNAEKQGVIKNDKWICGTCGSSHNITWDIK
ncbi:hypothetical protein H1S01_03270 [Heliobacterium chlorum]|uniref:30S ribosomal protein S27ae n=1 Tax=Heliobacterium chlorum TaxID=2698 RepID=A0ABR7T0A4_HELCL|nr:hypothetical protein [Heliobacterium chlorum]MBC9783532.1 hypothetical protein [Heliobacterium chlorum]